MNFVKYDSQGKSIVFCFIDNTHCFTSEWSKELIKNLSDYCISNINLKGYDIIQSQNEDTALQTAADQGYSHAVVFSTGTEFINGEDFFIAIENLVKNDYFIYGHILNRKEAYYELHHQCYLINLKIYDDLGRPFIGKTSLNSLHLQTVPESSEENIHDDYTPVWIGPGSKTQEYSHKLHGWNIVSICLKENYKIEAFQDSVRKNKKHYYPENQKMFLKHISWAYERFNYCANEFVHRQNTERMSFSKKYNQIITPASGTWYADYIDNSKPAVVVLYDYNQKALDFWKKEVPNIDNVTYKFIKFDLLTQNIKNLIINDNPDTLINFSNIFCYEGTAMFYSLEYRLQRELEILQQLPKEWTISFSGRSATGFIENFTNISIDKIKKPTWHLGADWQ